MKPIAKTLTSLATAVLVTVLATNVCCSQVTPGQIAPVFSLKDVEGTTHDLSQMKEESMLILYFFDVESRPSQEGLLTLDQLAKRYESADLNIWGITLSSKEKVADFSERTNPSFPVLLDKSGVSDLYQARLIMPTVCVLGPGLLVLDYFRGGGKTTEVMLVRVAERQLQQREAMLAKAVSDVVIKRNPKNLKAKTVKGYAALKEGSLNEAEETFHKLSERKGQGEILGKEGLTSVYAKKGETKRALEVAQEVEQKAPQRAYVHVIKGDLLFSQGKKKEAETEYRKAVQKEEGESFQKALAYNQFGRFQANIGNYQRARELYDQAVEMDPYYIEATSNKGMTYEKEGKWDKALNTYRQALSLDKDDTFAAVLAKKAEEMLSLQKDIAKRKRIDKLVKELAARYRSQKKSKKEKRDTWTSRPMVMSFIDFQEKGGLAQRDGFSTVLTTQLADQLNASGRVRVVERVLVDRLLEELNLGSSDLADPETALKLGKVLAAKVISTGSLFHLPDSTLLSMRLIDTETSAIPKVFTRQLGAPVSLEKELNRLNRQILKAIILEYPLKGFVVQAKEDEVMINLGSKQGVVLGTKFEVIVEKEPIKYKGKVLRSTPKAIAQVEVVRVEPDLCYARILKQERPLKSDDKVREKLEDVVALRGSDAI